MTDSLSGRAVLVTGAASGIGLASARILAARGARLMLSDIDASRGAQAAEALGAQGAEADFLACDVTAGEQVAALVERTIARFGRLDCAVNNAGVETRNQRLADHDDADFDRVIAVNLKGVYLCLKHELRAMLAQGGGVIVNIASLAGLGGAPQLGGYVASKHGVMGLTRTAALEYARRGIRVNAVCPSYTNTEMVQRMLAAQPQMKDVLDNASPMKRMGEPEEMANTVAWLCSDESSFVNGQGIAVDGGITAW